MLGSGAASSGLAFLGHYATQSWPILPSGNYRPLGQGQVLVGHSLWKKATDTYNSPGLLAPEPALPVRVALLGRLRGPLSRRPFYAPPERGHLLKRSLVSLGSSVTWERGH